MAPPRSASSETRRRRAAAVRLHAGELHHRGRDVEGQDELVHGRVDPSAAGSPSARGSTPGGAICCHDPMRAPGTRCRMSRTKYVSSATPHPAPRPRSPRSAQSTAPRDRITTGSAPRSRGCRSPPPLRRSRTRSTELRRARPRARRRLPALGRRGTWAITRSTGRTEHGSAPRRSSALSCTRSWVIGRGTAIVDHLPFWTARIVVADLVGMARTVPFVRSGWDLPGRGLRSHPESPTRPSCRVVEPRRE